MNDQTVEIILAEIRAVRDEVHDFRTEVNAWRQETGERLATLEANAKDISGNGQPGRMSKVEAKVTRHDRVIWIGYGILLSVQVAAALIIHYWPFGR